jgi:hypothetical protein
MHYNTNYLNILANIYHKYSIFLHYLYNLGKLVDSIFVFSVGVGLTNAKAISAP